MIKILTMTLFLSTSIYNSTLFAKDAVTPLLKCTTRSHVLNVSAQGNQINILRDITRVARGNDYVSGDISIKSNALLKATSIQKASKELILNLNDGIIVYFTIEKTADGQSQKVKITSNNSEVEHSLNSLLTSKENELEFYSLNTCNIL